MNFAQQYDPNPPRRDLRPSGRRRRTDSWWLREPMTPAIRAELWAMEDAGTKRKEMVAWLKRQGIKTSQPALTQFFKPVLAEEYEIRKASGTAQQLASAVAESGDLAGGGQAVVAKMFFDVIRAAGSPTTKESQDLLLNAASVFSQMQKAAYDQARLKLAQSDNELDQRKVALMEKKVAAAETVVADTALTAEQQAARIREIFQK